MVEPSQPIDLLLNLQRLEVVELRLVRLELCEVAILKAAERRRRCSLVYRRLPLHQGTQGVREMCAGTASALVCWLCHWDTACR